MILGYSVLLRFVQSIFPRMRVTRQRNLALLARGILNVRDGHLTMSEIARSFPGRSDHWVKFKRLRRFLSNLRWSPEPCFRNILRFVVQRFQADRYLPVIIDQSTLAGRFEILWACIPFRGRALPIAFRLFKYEDLRQDPEGSQNHLEEAFIRFIVDLLPSSPPPLLLLDRGYARVALLELLDALPLHYVLRVRKNTWVSHPEYEGLLANWAVQRGTLHWWPHTLFHRKERYPVKIAIALNHTAEEPWFLVTNLSRAVSAVRWYERRFRCEELFRDIKDQLKMETIRTYHRDRIARLILGIMISYLALTFIGAAAQQARLRRKICKDKVSLAWLALRLLYLPALLKPHLIQRALFRSAWSLSYESG